MTDAEKVRTLNELLTQTLADRDELSEEMSRCHHMLDVATGEYEEGMVALDTLEARLKRYIELDNEGRITDDMVNGDD